MVITYRASPDWVPLVLEAVRRVGYAVVEDVLDETFLEKTRVALRKAQRAIVSDVGEERLRRAGEIGVLRLMMKYEPHFFSFLELPAVLAVVDGTVGATAIMHLQNGFILPPLGPGERRDVFQTRFHMDFPRVLESYLASINTFFAIDTFTRDNGATLVVPASHQRRTPPTDEFMRATAVPVECSAGAMIVFDSTLWHAAGPNRSDRSRMAVNHQFTRSWIKQQIDYVRAVGDDVVRAQKPRTQQLLGWYTRVVTSLDEYYRPEDQRLYRRFQG
jgi:ectoine hydroxylase-related dioxygenase (phytanoyl-CoA dioxygenase family)